MGYIRTAAHRPCCILASGPRLALLGLPLEGPGRPGCVAHLPVGCSSSYGFVVWGAGRPVRPDVRGACLRKGRRLSFWSFWKQWQFALLSDGNYNRITTDHTTEAQSAQRLHDGGFGAVSILPILAGCGLASPGSP